MCGIKILNPGLSFLLYHTTETLQCYVSNKKPTKCQYCFYLFFLKKCCIWPATLFVDVCILYSHQFFHPSCSHMCISVVCFGAPIGTDFV
jgi:hypothetical protein